MTANLFWHNSTPQTLIPCTIALHSKILIINGIIKYLYGYMFSFYRFAKQTTQFIS